jgi:hypothetical protein
VIFPHIPHDSGRTVANSEHGRRGPGTARALRLRRGGGEAGRDVSCSCQGRRVVIAVAVVSAGLLIVGLGRQSYPRLVAGGVFTGIGVASNALHGDGGDADVGDDDLFRAAARIIGHHRDRGVRPDRDDRTVTRHAGDPRGSRDPGPGPVAGPAGVTAAGALCLADYGPASYDRGRSQLGW